MRSDGDLKMRILTVATAIALVATAATAPLAVAKGKKQEPTAQKTEDQAKKKAIDQAYKNALKTIPVSNEKFDPWKSTR
jgi:hypothetical protein